MPLDQRPSTTAARAARCLAALLPIGLAALAQPHAGRLGPALTALAVLAAGLLLAPVLRGDDVAPDPAAAPPPQVPPTPTEHAALAHARARQDEAIASWKAKADVNCDEGTLCHRVGLVCRLFGTTAAAIAVQLAGKGVTLPTWLAAALTVAVLLVAGVGEYFADMSRKHDYDARWTRIRQALDGMVADRDAEACGAGPFAFPGLTAGADRDRAAASLLTRRLAAWTARARGMAPQAPVPEA